jgi:Tol biopolymer transport system component
MAPDELLPDPPAGIVVSNASAGSGTGSSTVAGTSPGVPASSLAYVSAVAGTLSHATLAEIRNQTKHGAPRSVRIVNSGFDPGGIEAAAGDELSLTVFMNDGGAMTMRFGVPSRRPPTVVRTNPASGTDVGLTVPVVVVFSEPIDRASVTSSSVALEQDGNAVNGRVQVSADGLSAEFIPDSPLQPQTTYTLAINTGIHDLDGDALVGASAVTFTTAPVGTIIVTTATTALNSSDLDPDGYGVIISSQLIRQRIEVNGALTIASVPPGDYAVTLTGVNDNCIVAEGAIRDAVKVVAGAATTVAFDVSCEPVPEFARQLAFVSTQDGNSEIYAINLDGTGLVRLTNNAATDVDPAWSPDGNRIAFASNRGSGTDASDIYVMNGNGSNVVRLTAGGWNTGPTWSPDGKKIAFSGLRDGQWGIFVMSLDDPTNARNIAHDRGYQAYPSWSPDGSKIAFTSDWRAFDFLFDVYVANVDGSGITTLFAGPFFWVDVLVFYFQPAWSSDGRKIAVVVCTYTGDNCYPNSRIAIANADGSELKTLVTTGGFARPTWSPDGNTIAYSFQACRDCVGSLRYVTTDGSATGLIALNGHSPSWRR